MNSIVANVLSLSKDDFHVLVNDDIRGVATSEVSQALRTPDLAYRWYNALVSIKRNTETQLAADKADRTAKQAELLLAGESGKALWLDYKVKRDTWRSGAIRFKNGVEDKISEAKAILRSTPNAILAAERDTIITELARLRNAVFEHRESVEGGDEVDPRDMALWSAAERALV